MFGHLAYAHGLNVQSLLAARFISAGLLLALVALARRPAWPSRRTLLGLVALGAAGYFGQSAAYFNSIRYVPAAVTSILLYTYPVIVTLASVPLYGVRLTRTRTSALAVALGGCFLVANPTAASLRAEGIFLGLLSALGYSAYILTSKRILAGVDPWLATAVVALSAGAAYMTVGAATGTLAAPADAAAWLAVGGIAVVATVIGAGAFLAGLRLTDPGRASLVSTLEPVATAAFSLVFLGELLAPAQLAGGALVLLAVILVARSDPGVTPALEL